MIFLFWVCLPALSHGPSPTAQKYLTLSVPHQFSKSFEAHVRPSQRRIWESTSHCREKTPFTPHSSNAFGTHSRITIATMSCDTYLTMINLSIAVYYLMRLSQQFHKLSEDWFYRWGDWGSFPFWPLTNWVELEFGEISQRHATLSFSLYTAKRRGYLWPFIATQQPHTSATQMKAWPWP